jgi:hypothetical protein
MAAQNPNSQEFGISDAEAFFYQSLPASHLEPNKSSPASSEFTMDP